MRQPLFSHFGKDSGKTGIKNLFGPSTKFLLCLMMMLSTLATFAQDRKITGTILDEQGAALPGANIQVKGTSKGVSADANGKYSISVPANASTLVFTFIGYATQEVEIKNQSVIDLKLVADTKSLQEVVVVGYGTQKK
jgi:hypothetical protein